MSDYSYIDDVEKRVQNVKKKNEIFDMIFFCVLLYFSL